MVTQRNAEIEKMIKTRLLNIRKTCVRCGGDIRAVYRKCWMFRCTTKICHHEQSAVNGTPISQFIVHLSRIMDCM